MFTAALFTIGLIWLEAYFGKLILGWIGWKISIGKAIIIIVLSNLLYAFVKTIINDFVWFRRRNNLIKIRKGRR